MWKKYDRNRMKSVKTSYLHSYDIITKKNLSLFTCWVKPIRKNNHAHRLFKIKHIWSFFTIVNCRIVSHFSIPISSFIIKVPILVIPSTVTLKGNLNASWRAEVSGIQLQYTSIFSSFKVKINFVTLTKVKNA